MASCAATSLTFNDEIFSCNSYCPSARSAIQAKAQPSLRTYDNNGNVIGYWDEDGEIVAEYAYDAFGNTISATGSMAEVFPHRFSTKYYDAETDLYYYGYRYYSPSLGRWISRDPMGEEGGFGLYRFCDNAGTYAFNFLPFDFSVKYGK